MNRKERRAQAAQGSAAPAAHLDPTQMARLFGEAAELIKGQRYAAARDIYNALLRLMPDHPFALCNLGVIAYREGDVAGSLRFIKRAIAVDGRIADFHNSLGVSLEAAGKPEEALSAYRRAIALQPDEPGLFTNIGTLLSGLRRFDEAEEACRRAVALRPTQAEFHNNLGLMLHQRGRLDAALACFSQAIELRPTFPEAHNNAGNIHRDQGRLEKALVAYDKALALRPSYVAADSNAVLVLTYGRLAPAAEIARRAQIWEEHHGPKPQPASPAIAGKPDPERRLRVGFVSPDFHMHPVALFMAPVFRALAAPPLSARIETIAYADTRTPDAMTARLQKSVAHWRPIAGLGDDGVADLVRRDRIDILVDLTGHQSGNRLSLFARRPAPIQATYLGFPGSTGLHAIDYLITDHVAYPGAEIEPISETPSLLERCMVGYAPPDDVPAIVPRGDGPIVFGSFNQRSKLSRGTIALWSEILRRVPDSRLLLKASGLADESEAAHLSDAFAGHGVAGERLILRSHTKSVADHLATYGEIDIGLDPFPYNGTTTTVEALWMGVPVLTLTGSSMVERMGTTVLTAAGMDDWIACTPEEYLAKAIDFAGDRPALASLRASQRERLARAPLCDVAGLASALEEAFRRMWRKKLAVTT